MCRNLKRAGGSHPHLENEYGLITHNNLLSKAKGHCSPMRLSKCLRKYLL